jgi:hypothetical protein
VTRSRKSRDFRGRWFVLHVRWSLVLGRRFSSLSKARRFANRTGGIVRRWRGRDHNITADDLIQVTPRPLWHARPLDGIRDVVEAMATYQWRRA